MDRPADVQGKIVAGEKFSLRVTVDSLRNLIQDLVRAGHKPQAIVLSQYDRRELNQDLMAESVAPISKEDANRDDMQIAVIEGVQVGWNRTIDRGQCIIIPRA